MENKLEDESSNTSEVELPLPPDLLDDIEAGMSTLPSDLPVMRVNCSCSPQGDEMSRITANTDNIDEGDLMYDGHDLTKTSVAGGTEQTSDDNEECPRPTGAASSNISLTPSLRAAAPTPLRSSRRLSLPGAFRMGLGGVTVPATDEISRDESQSVESVGFQTHNAHEAMNEVLIEATLVSDQSIVTDDECRPRRQSDSMQFSIAASNQPDVALVEATPLHRFCLCDMLGNWKAICFIILVIIAIVAVAATIERNRLAGNLALEPPPQEVKDPSILEDLSTVAPPSVLTTPITPTPTALHVSSVSILSVLEEAEIPLKYPSEAPIQGAEGSSAGAEKPPEQSFVLAPILSPTKAPTLEPTTRAPMLAPTEAPSFTPSNHQRTETPSSEPVPTTLALAEAPSFIPSNHQVTETPSSGPVPPMLALSEAPSFIPSNHQVTETPTSAPTLIKLPLPEYTLQALNNPRSPQSLALDWLFEDPKQLEYSTDKQIQRFALATFYFALNGELWMNRTNWLSYDFDECLWHTDLEPQERVCVTATTPVQDSEYQALVMHTNDMVGNLPKETWLLTSLSTVALFEQPVRGELPEEVGSLTNMKDLTLRQLVLTGSLPSTLGRLGQLTSLKMDKNWFHGSIPSEFGRMENIQHIYLSRNNLSGPLPSDLGVLPNLEVLSIHSNAISGMIPTELGLLPKLQKAYLSNNQFTGVLPLELITELTASSLQILDLGNNKISGTLPASLGLLTNAHTLDLYGNQITGSLPTELGLLENVSSILLDSNHLTGTVPSQLGLLTNLDALSLENNALSGSLPEEICNLKMINQNIIIIVDCSDVSCSCDCCGCNCGITSGSGEVTLTSRVANDLHQSTLP
ncbi:expressed unknown protein [Seminavis robusta]|uniref:L domain-like protein n=1 Tax=Seminavis robusta TaxID=568900 RepID=A0A9N8EIJ7_9STRA|nr:expressed unknown protein [Seminavis robusta]|eukprot:Sro1048_g235200.2  (861) ;mRNA; r:9886-12468